MGMTAKNFADAYMAADYEPIERRLMSFYPSIARCAIVKDRNERIPVQLPEGNCFIEFTIFKPYFGGFSVNTIPVAAAEPVTYRANDADGGIVVDKSKITTSDLIETIRKDRSLKPGVIVIIRTAPYHGTYMIDEPKVEPQIRTLSK